MHAYKKFLTETFETFFEGHVDALNSIIGNKDSRKGHVILINDMNLYLDQEEKSEFENKPDFVDGYELVTHSTDTITIKQKFNLSEISKNIGLPIDETKEEIKEFIKNITFYFNSTIDNQDFRGYYKLNKIINEEVKTQGDVYLELDLLLGLVELTSLSGLTKGRTGIKVGKGKEDIDNEEETETPKEPTDEEIKRAGANLGATEESVSFKMFRELKEGN